MSFNGKVVLITGASSGIGANAAVHLAKLGAKVVIVGRNEQKLNEVNEEIKKLGRSEPIKIIGDVTKDAERIVNESIKRFGKLDALVNSAGFAIRDSPIDVDLSEFDRVFDTNVRSVINLTKLCVPHLEKTKGNIVNISSVVGLRPNRNLLSYSISKSALDQFTKCAALELAPRGIRVNSVNPGVIRTNVFEPMGMTSEQFSEIQNVLVKKYPLGRVGEVADTSAAIAYLADSNVASFLTGILLPVDGGSMIAGIWK